MAPPLRCRISARTGGCRYRKVAAKMVESAVATTACWSTVTDNVRQWPSQPRISRPKGVQTFPVAERYGYVWLWIGDAASADESLLPDMPWDEGGDWAYGSGVYRINCDYRLLIDNLMDLSHELYVHPESIGQSEIDEAKPDISIVDGVVTVSRWMLDITPPPFRAGLFVSLDPVDRWQVCRFHAPSNVHIDVGVAAAGTGAPDGDRSHGITGLVVDFITPETEHSCWYFWGMARNFQQDDAELTNRIREGQRKIFARDSTFSKRNNKACYETLTGDSLISILMPAANIVGGLLRSFAVARRACAF